LEFCGWCTALATTDTLALSLTAAVTAAATAATETWGADMVTAAVATAEAVIEAF
jgi:hypothetical protein